MHTPQAELSRTCSECQLTRVDEEDGKDDSWLGEEGKRGTS